MITLPAYPGIAVVGRRGAADYQVISSMFVSADSARELARRLHETDVELDTHVVEVVWLPLDSSIEIRDGEMHIVAEIKEER